MKRVSSCSVTAVVYMLKILQVSWGTDHYQVYGAMICKKDLNDFICHKILWLGECLLQVMLRHNMVPC
jgi:hypothetical protein